MRKVALLTIGLTIASMAAMGAPAGEAGAQSSSYRLVKGIEYAHPGGVRLLMNAYVPNTPGLHPAVLAIHGGGWRYGGLAVMSNEAAYLAERGFAAFTVQYRLAPQYPYPAAVEDCQAAVAFIRGNAARFSVDPARIGAIGGSAGGNLVGMLASLGQGSRDTGSRIRVGVSWSGPMDLAEVVRDGPEHPRKVIGEYLACDPYACDQRLHDASPLSFVDGSDAALFIANGTTEQIPFPQAREMADALGRVRLPYKLVPVPGRNHSRSYENQHTAATGNESVLEASAEFLRTWINQSSFGSNIGPAPSTPPPSAGPGPTTPGPGGSPSPSPTGPGRTSPSPGGGGVTAGPTQPPGGGSPLPGGPSPGALPGTPSSHVISARVLVFGGLILLLVVAGVAGVSRMWREDDLP